MFEWDENKRIKNIAEHGVDFRLAVGIFFKPIVEETDNRSDYGEVRIRALGTIKNHHLTVIYTWRGNKRRIISAWKAGKNGKRKYQAILNGTNKSPN